MFYVSISSDAIEKVRRNAQENLENEVIGLLTGRMENNVLIIEDAVTGKITSERDHATLLPDAIAKIADKIVRGEVQGNIVGWYHSHPGHGVFISDIDMRTQVKLQQFSPYIVSLVIDPTKDEIGFFTIDMHTKSPVLINEEYTHIFNPGEEAIPPKFQEQNREEFYQYPPPDRGIGRRPETSSKDAKTKPASRKPNILFIGVAVAVIACVLIASLLILLPLRNERPRAYIIIDSPKPNYVFLRNETVKINGTLFLEANGTLIRPNANVTLNITVFSSEKVTTESENITVQNGSFLYENFSWPPPANVTLQAIFTGNDTYAPASSEIRFEIGKRNTTLTIDTSKPEYITGTLMDTYQKAIANATVIISNQTSVSSIEGQEIDWNRTDPSGNYEVSWNYTENPSGTYLVFATFNGSDFYNPTNSRTMEVFPNSTVLEFRNLSIVGGNATFNVTVTNTGFLRDQINITLNWENSTSTPVLTNMTAIPGWLSPNEPESETLTQSTPTTSGVYWVYCSVTSSITGKKDSSAHRLLVTVR